MKYRAPNGNGRRNKPPRPTISCEICYDLNLDVIPKPHNDPNHCSIGQAARYWIKSSQLKMSSSHGCETCSLLQNAVGTLIQKAGITDTTKQVKYQLAVLDPDETRSNSQSLGLVVRCSLNGEDGYSEEFNIELFTHYDSPPARWPAIGTAGEVPTQPSGEECANIINSWLADCDTNHHTCQSDIPQNQPLPKRVLDVSQGNVVLIETNGKTGQYIALSHCWGKEQLLITTRDTLEERMRGIKWEELPQTFQDAITITRGLEIQYLWIDSLCIIQKDKLDWEQQSAVMADIYAKSYLNLATTRSSSGLEGCLSYRWTSRDTIHWQNQVAEAIGGEGGGEEPRIRKWEVRSFEVPTDDKSQHIYVRLALESSHQTMLTARWIGLHKDTAPLLQRAWVYQERTLSTRTVHLHANEMVWSCKTKLLCECKTLDGSPPSGDGQSASKDEIANLGNMKNTLEVHGLWRKVVEDYTKLDLTYETDRLPALSGLVNVFSARFSSSGKYLAGLWGGDLARDLLWQPGGGGVYDGGKRRRHSKPCPPSWSWASLIWGGNSDGHLRYEAEFKPKIVEWDHAVAYEQDPRLSIISASCSVEGENPFGQVSAGSVVLEGAVCSVVITRYGGPVDEPQLGDYENSDLEDDNLGSSSEQRGHNNTESGSEIENDSGTDDSEDWEDCSSSEGSLGSGGSALFSPSRSQNLSPPNLTCLLFDHDIEDDYVLIETQYLEHDVAPTENLEGKVVICVFVGNFIKKTIPARSTEYMSLVLKPSEGVQGAFERIGICIDSPWDKVGSRCSKYAKRTRIEIV